MLIYSEELDLLSESDLVGDYNITSEDLEDYRDLVLIGREEEAVEQFILDYMLEEVSLYEDTLSKYMTITYQGELPEDSLNNLLASIAGLSLALSFSLKSNVSKFVTNVVGPNILDKAKIVQEDVREAILRETTSRFNTLVDGAMSQTQGNVLGYIREMQRRLIVENQLIRNKNWSESTIQLEIARFRQELKDNFPQYFKAMEERKFLTSKRFGEFGEKVNYYKLDNYLDMSIRTTILNVDRVSVEVSAKAEDMPVVEYYLRDNRVLKTGQEREICRSILSDVILDKSILAVTQEASELLGIMTIEEAQNTPDYAMGVYCRHSIRLLSKTYLRKINAIMRQEKEKLELANA